jgi:hypothetical protein
MPTAVGRCTVRAACPTNLASQMARGSAFRNRSESVTVGTPRGSVEVVRQEVKGLRRNTGWTWFWVARRAGHVDWHEASTPAEAIRRAILLPARKPPEWLRQAAATAEAQLLAGNPPEAETRIDDDTPG